MSMESVAVIICCFNGAGRLPKTLERLALQRDLSLVILVDNASSDDTAAVAQRVWNESESGFPLRVVSEPRAGIVYARQCGLNAALHARVDVVLFVDDDNWLHGQWAPVLKRVFLENPQVAAVGGLGRAVCEGDDTPSWFIQHQAAYACGPQGDPGLVPFSRGFLFGACLALRMKAWQSIASKFSPLLTGRKGSLVLAGDDAELCFFLQEHGWRLWYEPSLCFDHYMPKFRLDVQYCERLYFGFGMSSRILLLRRSQLMGNRAKIFLSKSAFIYRTLATLRFYTFFPLLILSKKPSTLSVSLRGATVAV